MVSIEGYGGITQQRNEYYHCGDDIFFVVEDFMHSLLNSMQVFALQAKRNLVVEAVMLFYLIQLKTW